MLWTMMLPPLRQQHLFLPLCCYHHHYCGGTWSIEYSCIMFLSPVGWLPCSSIIHPNFRYLMCPPHLMDSPPTSLAAQAVEFSVFVSHNHHMLLLCHTLKWRDYCWTSPMGWLSCTRTCHMFCMGNNNHLSSPSTPPLAAALFHPCLSFSPFLFINDLFQLQQLSKHLFYFIFSFDSDSPAEDQAWWP